jgi:GNAT superfamily N-acetyltransferase
MPTIRRAEPKDAAAAVDIVRGSITTLCRADHHDDAATLAMWLANKTVQNFLSWLANDDNFCIVAEAGDDVAGIGLLHRSGEVRLFYLASDMQRQGIGKAIHRALESQATTWGLEELSLDSTILARPFYEALGYRSTGPAIPRFGMLHSHPYQKTLQSSTI